MEIAVKANEAAALADLVFQELETRALSDETRGRLADRLGGLGLSGLRPHAGSLTRDPVHSASYYLAADALADGGSLPLLLRLGPASSHSGELLRGAALIGRMRPGGGREVVVEAAPFGAGDHENIRVFIDRIDAAFQPRARGAQPALVVSSGNPLEVLPGAFDAYGSILNRTGWNAAAIAYTGAMGESSSADLWHATAWAAIRAGWRDGYSIEAHHINIGDGGVTEIVEELIRQAAGYTRFRLDASRLFDYRADHRTRHGWSEPDVERLYHESLANELRGWIEDEFRRPFDLGAVTHSFAPHEVRRLSVKFGHSLLCIERLYDTIANIKTRQQDSDSTFEFEPSLVHAQTITRPKELTFCLHWLKARGRPAQSIVPNLAFLPKRPYPETTEEQLEYLRGNCWDEIAEYTGVVYPGKPLEELAHRVSELAAVARHFGATLTVEAVSGKQPSVIQLVGRSAAGHVNVVMSIDGASEDVAEHRVRRHMVSVVENLRS